MEHDSTPRACADHAAPAFHRTNFVARPAQTDAREFFRAQPRILPPQFRLNPRRDELFLRESKLPLSMGPAHSAHNRFSKFRARVEMIPVDGDSLMAFLDR